MPDFKAIQSSEKRRDPHDGRARHRLHSLVIELLRVLARGDDSQQRVFSHLVELVEHLSKTHTPHALLVDEVMAELYDELTAKPGESEYEADIRSVVISSLRVAAESLADDPAAVGRRRSRKNDLDRDIKQLIVRREKQARRLMPDAMQKARRRTSKWDDIEV